MARALDIWVVDDDQSVRWVLTQALTQAGMTVRSFDDAYGLLEAFEVAAPDVIVTDVRMPGMDGMRLMEHVARVQPDVPVIVMTAHSDLDSAVSAYRGGAFEYLPKPFDIDEAVELVKRAARESEPAADEAPASAAAMGNLIGRAPAMQDVFRSIGRLARSSMTVLITGESGTGKELIAQALHQHSPRAARPFVALNTSAITAELLESELFGHERGAFTGADSRRIGRFEQADGGTLFLDEIGDMSRTLQTRLLRVLAESEFYRVGGQSAIRVDVRVIAATHQNLEQAVGEGRFREDLFHRLNVIRIESPPLRARREDIPLLLEHFLARAADELGAEAKTLAADAEALLVGYEWPGNVRQLVNTCRRLTVTAPGTVVRPADLPGEMSGGAVAGRDDAEWVSHLRRWADQRLRGGKTGPLLGDALPEFERTLISVALARSNGHRQDAAKLLGWGRNTLTRKIRALDLDTGGAGTEGDGA
ncbi:MAG: nitrogen regulation protein NR(I) [Pseudomonadota bacterium]